MKKKFLIFAVIFVLTVSATIPAYASPLSTKLKYQQQQLKKNKAAYNNIIKQIDQMEISIEKFDNQIEDLMGQIDNINSKIVKTKSEIRDVEKQIENSEDQIKNEQGLLNERIKVTYMNGTSVYLEIILSSKSLSDLLDRVEMIEKIIEFDRNLISNLKEKKQEIVQKKLELENKNKQLAALQKENVDKLNELKSKKNQQASLIKSLELKQRYYASKISLYQDMVKATQKQIQAIQNKYKHVSTSVYSSNAVVAYALKFLGTRYVWGGSTPSGFDCSGFTQYVYAHFGISIPRTSTAQSKFGDSVSRGNLQPGDLVFFGSPVHHVGIYVGNNMFIEAPRTGDVVKISPLTRSDYSGARRVK